MCWITLTDFFKRLNHSCNSALHITVSVYVFKRLTLFLPYGFEIICHWSHSGNIEILFLEVLKLCIQNFNRYKTSTFSICFPVSGHLCFSSNLFILFKFVENIDTFIFHSLFVFIMCIICNINFVTWYWQLVFSLFFILISLVINFSNVFFSLNN